LLTVKALRRELVRVKEAIDGAHSCIEIMVARSECLKRQELRNLDQKYGPRTAWIYVVAPYKFIKTKRNTKKRASRIERYTSALEAGFERNGKGS
jgi:hypothetical protein